MGRTGTDGELGDTAWWEFLSGTFIMDFTFGLALVCVI